MPSPVAGCTETCVRSPLATASSSGDVPSTVATGIWAGSSDFLKQRLGREGRDGAANSHGAVDAGTPEYLVLAIARDQIVHGLAGLAAVAAGFAGLDLEIGIFLRPADRTPNDSRCAADIERRGDDAAQFDEDAALFAPSLRRAACSSQPSMPRRPFGRPPRCRRLRKSAWRFGTKRC